MKTRLFPSFTSLGFAILAAPVVLAIGIALWLTAAVAYENVKFVHCTDQLLSIIKIAREDAADDPDFGQRSGEDLIEGLTRRAQFNGPAINSWNGGLRLTV